MALTTDATLRIQLTPAQVLQDEDRMKRLKAALCDGLLSYADEQVAAQVIDETLKICGGSAETVSEVLQTQLFMQYTPFYWIITNRPSTKPGAPPLLVRLLSICTVLTQQTQEEIIATLGQKYDSGVYIAVRPKLTGVPTHEVCNTSFFKDVRDQPVITYQPETPLAQEFSFRIPKFFDRLAVEGEAWMDFLAMGICLRLRASLENPHPSMPNRLQHCQIELRATSRPTQGNFHATLELNSGDSAVPVHSETLFFYMPCHASEASCSYLNTTTPEVLHRRLYPNSSQKRELSGTVKFY